MVRARWWLIVVMALLGLGAAIAFTNYSNDNIEQRYRAVATIEFIVEETEEPTTSGGRNQPSGGGGAAADLVETAEEAALEINAKLLEEPNVSMRADTANGTLDFTATASSAELAEEIVAEMRDRYVAVDPTAVDVNAEINRLISEASEIQERLSELQPPPEPEDLQISVSAQARIDVLNNQITSAIGEVGQLETDLEEADTDEAKAEIQSQIDAVVVRVTDLREEVDELTPDELEAIVFVLTPAEELEKSALDNRLIAIGTEYQGVLDVEKSGDRVNLPELATTDETPAEADLTLSGLIGVIAGAVAGLVILVLIDRLQGTVWTPRDMAQVPTLAEVPQHGSRVELRPRRYQAVRQKGIQSVRSAVLGLYHAAGPTTIGYTALGTSEASTSELVLDVAQGLAAVGRSVLLVDGHLLGNAAYRDQVGGGSTLADLVVQDTDDTLLSARIAQVLDGCVQIAPNLAVLPGDPHNVDAVDILASKSFRTLTQRAQEQFDVVMVVGPSALSPFAYVMTGLVSAYVVVTTMGKTRQAHIAQLATQFAGSRSRLLGAVLLGIKPRRGWVPASDLSRAAAEQAAAAAAGSSGSVEVVDELEGEQGLLDRLGQSLASLAGDKPDQ